MAEIKGYTNLTDGSLRLAPDSFTQINADPNKEGWRLLDTDINPYIDEVFYIWWQSCARYNLCLQLP